MFHQCLSVLCTLQIRVDTLVVSQTRSVVCISPPGRPTVPPAAPKATRVGLTAVSWSVSSVLTHHALFREPVSVRVHVHLYIYNHVCTYCVVW